MGGQESSARSRHESDKTIIVQRDSGEFGFRIHGSKPVVVSAIEPGTPAETSGLVVGDIVLSVNDVSVLDKSHSEVVKIAHAGSDILKLEDLFTSLVKRAIRRDLRAYNKRMIQEAIEDNMNMRVIRSKTTRGKLLIYKMRNEQGVVVSEKGEIVTIIENFYRRLYSQSVPEPDHFQEHRDRVARTCYMLNTPKENSSVALHSGYLWKLKGYASGTTFNKWIRRWFCLKENNCLYYYKTDSDKEPVGVLTLFDHTLKNSTLIKKVSHEVPLYLAADTSNAQERWMEVISKAINDGQVIDNFLERTKTNLVIPPAAICQPDCFGYLIKLGNQWKAWSRTYCVLKDACLYFYHDINASSAYGAAYLHGYRVQQFLSGNKKHAFEVVPPDSGKKYYYFQTESEADRKRWIAALEYSIDKWLKVGETSG
ncbi:hypothetical protein NQ318_018409 [Aromia moschata]|uniref:Uncharacterized protein n=1 Tax=Aromia moschata TaxID=1265417 RepID=A0AAV8XAM0_9CUCU|nr:hypothetical protein NQ318_018409 [Aromia moschata]